MKTNTESLSLAAAFKVNNPTADSVMFAPAGVHCVNCGLGGVASATVYITVDKAAAEVLNNSLQANNADGHPQRSLFDKEHEHKEAMAWPTGFAWRDGSSPGIYASVEWSSLGEQFVTGKVMRAFSGQFFTDADLPRRRDVVRGKHYEIQAGRRGSETNPARIIDLDFPYAGTLTNNPAFRMNAPLWAKNSEPGKNESTYGDQMIQDKTELQARRKDLETARAGLNPGDAETADKLAGIDNELAQIETAEQRIKLEEDNTRLRAEVMATRTKDAQDAVRNAVKRGVIAPKDAESQRDWETKCTEDPKNIALLAKMQGHPAIEPQAHRPSYAPRYSIEREDTQHVLQAFGREQDPLKRAAHYTSIRSRMKEGDPVPLMAATNTLGTVAGSLVSQMTLELLTLQFPILSSITTDFSAEQSKLNQTIYTRIIGIPATVAYSTTNGWVEQNAVFTDASVVLNTQKGVPIQFNSAELAGTARRLFDEIAPAQAYALGKDMVDALYALITAGNFSAASNIASVDFGRGALVDVGVALDNAAVPPLTRFALVNATYYGAVLKSSDLTLLGANQQSGIITGNVLPDVNGFRVIKAVNMPTTGSLAGIAGTKSCLLMAARPDNDYLSAAGAGANGTSAIITDPNTGLSILQVLFVDNQKAFVTQRISMLWGVAVGQAAAARRITGT